MSRATLRCVPDIVCRTYAFGFDDPRGDLVNVVVDEIASHAVQCAFPGVHIDERTGECDLLDDVADVCNGHRDPERVIVEWANVVQLTSLGVYIGPIQAGRHRQVAATKRAVLDRMRDRLVALCPEVEQLLPWPEEPPSKWSREASHTQAPYVSHRPERLYHLPPRLCSLRGIEQAILFLLDSQYTWGVVVDADGLRNLRLNHAGDNMLFPNAGPLASVPSRLGELLGVPVYGSTMANSIGVGVLDAMPVVVADG